MNKDQIRGKWEELKGKIKRSYGEATADRKVQAEGTLQEGAGKVQSGMGEAAEKISKKVEDVKRDLRGEPPSDGRH